MLANSKIALSVALVLATVSTAFAAPKQATVRHQPTIERQVPANAYQSFGAVRRSTGSVNEPSNQKIQDRGFRRSGPLIFSHFSVPQLKPPRSIQGRLFTARNLSGR